MNKETKELIKATQDVYNSKKDTPQRAVSVRNLMDLQQKNQSIRGFKS